MGLIMDKISFFVMLLLLTPTTWAKRALAYENTSFSSLYNNGLYDSNTPINLFWNLDLGGENFESQVESGLTYRAQAKLKLRYRLIDQLELNSTAALNFVGGRVQQRFESGPESAIYLKHASLDYKVLGDRSVLLTAGVLNQGRIFSFPNFISNGRAFPGVGLNLKFNLSTDFILNAYAQYTIPTSYTLGTDLREKEETPQFVSALLTLIYEKNNCRFCVSVTGGYFQYENLPSALAEQANFRGNQVQGFASNSIFIYEFAGLVAGANLRYQLSPRLGFKASYRVSDNLGNSKLNQPGLEKRGRAQNIEASAYYRLSQSLGLGLTGGTYFTESDAVPSNYNSGSLGHNNREAYLGKISLEIIPARFKVWAQFNQTYLINDEDFGKLYDKNYFAIGLETAYQSFFKTKKTNNTKSISQRITTRGAL